MICVQVNTHLLSISIMSTFVYNNFFFPYWLLFAYAHRFFCFLFICVSRIPWTHIHCTAHRRFQESNESYLFNRNWSKRWQCSFIFDSLAAWFLMCDMLLFRNANSDIYVTCGVEYKTALYKPIHGNKMSLRIHRIIYLLLKIF